MRPTLAGELFAFILAGWSVRAIHEPSRGIAFGAREAPRVRKPWRSREATRVHAFALTSAKCVARNSLV
jgi:hypothetical protein